MIPEDINDSKEREAREEAAKQLRMAYSRLFDSLDGQTVLADLLHQFGFLPNRIEKSTYVFGIPPDDFIHRDGSKQPVRYILGKITPSGGEIKPQPTIEAEAKTS